MEAEMLGQVAAVEMVRDDHILDVLEMEPMKYSDGVDVECERGKKEALRIKLCVFVPYCSLTNYPKLAEL